MSTKDEIRSAVFSQKPASKVITFVGQQIELRQPPVSVVISDDVISDPNASDTERRQAAAVKAILDYSYVPGTDERVFDETDRDGLMALPFNKDWVDLQSAINELTNIGSAVMEAEKK